MKGNIHLPYEPAVPFLVIDSQKRKHTSTQRRLRAVLFIIAQVFINKWMDKQMLEHPFRGILLSNAKGGSTDTGNVTGETQEHDGKEKKAGTHCCIPFL